ncbi:MAG: glycosyltransferase family 9 protein [Bacteroidota bacterium]|nr:glycosyltransferase family 9 protein [Bacteroidota bacterium]
MSETKHLRFKNVLCIRADNMGDVLMSTPAFQGLKETFDCKITLLTSAMGKLIAPFIKEIDDTIIANVPWVKTNDPADEIAFAKLVQTITSRAFDAAFVFTVYSQNPLPAAMLAFLSGIPVRVAYCRENPYSLLTHWLPDEEPFLFIQHQVDRDIKLVQSVGASASSQQLSITFKKEAKQNLVKKLNQTGIDATKPFVIFHPGASEDKRKYPTELWIEAGKKWLQKQTHPIVITGSLSEASQAHHIASNIGGQCVSAAGLFSVEEWIAAIDAAQLLVSVNTGTVHIAAALQKPVVVLYALTNPQHTPWQTPNKVLYFSVKEELKSKNEIVRYVAEKVMKQNVPYPTPDEVIEAIDSLLNHLLSSQ